MRIGVLTTSYPRGPGDLAGRFVAELCEWLAGQGHEVEVLAPHPGGRPPAVVPGRGGPRVHRVRYALRPRLLYGAGAPDNLRSPAVWLQVAPFAAALTAACRARSRRWDSVMSHWLLPCGVAAALGSRGLPHLAVAHSSDVHLMRRLPAIGRAALRVLGARRARLVLTSASLRPLLLDLAGGERERRLVREAPVVRMGIPSRLLHLPAEPGLAARRALGLESARVALFLGRLVPVKGADVLLRAFAGLAATLVVAGDGPERPRLESLARDLGCRARFVGARLGPERDAWLGAADLLVLPSLRLPDGRTESAPVTLLEAMAAGLPVVATDVGGNAELLTSGENGLLVPPGDPAALRVALQRLLEDPALGPRLAAAARKTAAQNTWDQVGPRLAAAAHPSERDRQPMSREREP